MLSKIFASFLLFSLFFSLVSAHDIVILNNELNVKSNYIEFKNDGSIYAYLGENYKRHLNDNLLIFNNGERCEFGEFEYSDFPLNGFKFRIYCEGEIKNVSVEDYTLSNHSLPVNKIYNVNLNGEKKVFTGDKEFKFELEKEQKEFYTFIEYLILGVEHILFGIDHIFFIVGFILIAGGFKSLLKNVSGFTLSHSFTLTLAALGIFVLSPSIVEPLIAASIFVVGLGGLVGRDKWMNGFWLIFAFGLFHGLGFAGAISEVGFPKGDFVSALLGFNLGIELGQIGIILLVYPLIYLMNKSGKIGKFTKISISSVIVLAGLIWFVERIY